MTKIPLGLHVGERLSLEQTLWQAQLADDSGFEAVWVAEGRMARDGIVPAAVLAHQTRRIRIGTGVINNKSRIAPLTAVTFKTLDEYAPNRVLLGIGAWWEPLATKLGTPLVKPLKTMREYVFVLQSFFRNELVEFDGEFVQVRGARFDSMYRENVPVNIPIYIGAVGMKMLELSGEISDGVLLDFLLPPSYVENARSAIEVGLRRGERDRCKFDVTMIVSCSINDSNPDEAVNACRAFLTLYLMQQPHIAEHCGVDPDLVSKLKQIAGWPAMSEDVRRAMHLVSDDLVHRVTACGTTRDVVNKLEEYCDAGVRCPVISTLGDKEQTLTSIARALK